MLVLFYFSFSLIYILLIVVKLSKMKKTMRKTIVETFTHLVELKLCHEKFQKFLSYQDGFSDDFLFLGCLSNNK